MTRSIAQAFIAAAELRSGGVITEQEIKALKKRWSGHTRNRHNENVPGGHDAFSEQERVEQFAPYRISEEQCAKGLAWWRAKLFKKDGTLRQTKFTAYLSGQQLDRTTLAVLYPSHFELVEFVEEWNQLGNMCWVYPRYRLVGKEASFVYTARAWQAGEDQVQMDLVAAQP